ncbi:hypothetical protein [Nocardioides kribbensis]|uniref:hypothetical protein n=1 Tax=Nocardioides kribbensis TaxID=305517 RepID=UPI0032DA7E98
MSPKRAALLSTLASAALVATGAGAAQADGSRTDRFPADRQSQLVGLQQQDADGSQQLGVLSTSHSGERRQSQLLGAQQSSREGQQQAGLLSRQSDDRGRTQDQLLGAQQQDSRGDQQQLGLAQQQSGGRQQQQAGALQGQRSAPTAATPSTRLDLAGLIVLVVR